MNMKTIFKCVNRTEKTQKIAEELNNTLEFQGAWFFQVKEDVNGNLKLMEFSVRQAGTMAFYRQLGINFAALSIFVAMGLDVKIIFNDCKLILERRLTNSYVIDYEYDKVYIDFDDTLIINGKVNSTLIKFIYQSLNLNRSVILITKHEYDLDAAFIKYRLNKELFDEIILLKPDESKYEYIDGSKSIFIDNYFLERMEVKEICKIPVFDVDAVECLIHASEV